jgi:RNA polymerase sigma-70 factor (ECF subfamily)
MSDDDPFIALVRRVRAGDQQAATELVQLYAPAIRRTVRFSLQDPRLRRVLDSIDVCQSVLGNFFARAALGQFQLDTPEQLLRLLVSMARNKVAAEARRPSVRRRDARGVEPGDDRADEPVAPGDSPSQFVAGRDLLETFRKRLTEEERVLADLRAQGREWSEIAIERGENAEALRKRLARGLNRVAQELGLDEEDAS